jgi:hypothetical protein
MKDTMKIGVVTCWHGSAFEEMARWTVPGKRKYCERFCHDFIAYDYLLDPSRRACWQKIVALRKVLAEYDWLLWCDGDTVLWNPDVDLRRFVIENEGKHLIIQENHQGLNSGVFLIHNHPWSFQFLDRVYDQRHLEHHPWCEQQAIIELMADPAWRDATKIYSRQEPHGGFHGYWFFQDWDKLLIHFPGLDNIRRQRFIENTARLAAYPHHLRLLHRDGLGNFLNQLGLIGEGAIVGADASHIGQFSGRILEQWAGKRLHFVVHSEHGVRQALQPKSTGQAVAPDFLAVHRNRVSSYAEPSTEAAARFPDLSLDFAYIDADHRYEAVSADIQAWYPKLKPGGLFAGHDFLDGTLPQGKFGVKTAVSEFERRAGLSVAVTADRDWPTWYVFKPT